MSDELIFYTIVGFLKLQKNQAITMFLNRRYRSLKCWYRLDWDM